MLPCSTSLCSKLSLKSCRSKLLRSCPKPSNSLRLCSTTQQKHKKLFYNGYAIFSTTRNDGTTELRNYGSMELRKHGTTESRNDGTTELRNYGITESRIYGSMEARIIFFCFCFLEALASFGCVLVSAGRWCKLAYNQIHDDSRTRARQCQAFKKYFFYFFPILNESNLPLGLGRFPINGNAQMFFS